LEVYPNIFYYAKTSKFINMLPNIKRTRSQIMIHLNIYTKKSQEYFINDKVQSSYVQCTLKKNKELIFTQFFCKTWCSINLKKNILLILKKYT
jgi:hypothetical protein